MSEIKPKYVDGEPVCSSEHCPQFERCPFVLPGYETCFPALRQQRDKAEARVREGDTIIDVCWDACSGEEMAEDRRMLAPVTALVCNTVQQQKARVKELEARLELRWTEGQPPEGVVALIDDGEGLWFGPHNGYHKWLVSVVELGLPKGGRVRHISLSDILGALDTPTPGEGD